MENKIIEFWVEILVDKYVNKHSKYLYGFIRSLDIDFDKLYEISFLIINENNEIERRDLPEIINIYTNENSKIDNCCYFKLENIYSILENYKALDKLFYVEIKINGQPIKSIEPIQHK